MTPGEMEKLSAQVRAGAAAVGIHIKTLTVELDDGIRLEWVTNDGDKHSSLSTSTDLAPARLLENVLQSHRIRTWRARDLAEKSRALCELLGVSAEAAEAAVKKLSIC